MVRSIFRFCSAMAGCALGLGGGAGSASAQLAAGNPDVQMFIEQTVCFGDPTGLFLERCAETENNGTFANISTDSESSLNPSQTGISASNALAIAQALATDTEKRLKSLRAGEGDDKGEPSDTIASFGPWSVFTTIEGEWFDQSRRAFDNERGFDGDRVRGSVGADRRIGRTGHIGAMISYETYKLTFDREPAAMGFIPLANAGSHRAETISGTAFATFELGGGGWIDVSAGYGTSDNDFRRNAIFQPSTRRTAVNVNTRGSADGDQIFASIGAGYDFSHGSWSVGPYLRGRYVRSEIDAYAETDIGPLSGLAIEVPQQKATSLAAILGLRSTYAIGTRWGVIVPQARAEYEHEFEDDARTTSVQFVLDPRNVGLPVTSDAPDRDHFNVGAGLLFVLPHGISPFIDYEALLGYAGFDRHRVAAGLRIEF